ncbi:Protein kinase Scy1 [Aspergillus sclerotialis]|uniref:Protein kinase Scy1 n=1 Tax=Aspergillus sclerotialis TaxID=2070753 RepID=A0A3A3A826_9EURO|nr:Protein kinase Scy1 [Aspergillus sclerotialis]
MFSSAFKSLSSNILANYQISQHPSAVSGPWKIHNGSKKSTGTPASIFVFDRKTLEPRSGGLGSRANTSTKKLQEEVIDRLKREASNLARLRHPSILQVLEPVEETRNGGLMFATELITASLSGLLQEKDAQERAVGLGSRASHYMVEDSDGRRSRRDLDIDELEIQKGLLQVAKGLEFLHESAGLVHGNLNPDAIFINAKSDWKISGLGFAGSPDASQVHSSVPPLALSEVLYQDPRLPSSVQLNLDYTSPDFVLDSNVTTSADLFSLGLIIITLYNSPHISPIQTHSNLNTYKKIFSTPSTTPSQGNNFLCSGPIPKDILAHVLPRLITRRPSQRLNAQEFQQSQYFDNILVSTIRFLESLPAKSLNEKSQFMRGLQRVIPEFPPSVLERKLLGALLEELKDRELLSLILQNVFGILRRIPNARRTFPEKVIPRLREVFRSGPSKGVQERDSKRDAGLMVVLENMKIVTENCSGKEFKDDILPLIWLGMDAHTHSLNDAAIKCLSVILPVLDFSTVKNEVFPPIASTFSKTSSLAIKVRCLDAFTVLCGGTTSDESDLQDGLSGTIQTEKSQSIKSSILDKYTIQEKLVPSLKAIKTKEPAVMMAALNVFRQVGEAADTDFLALEVLPILWSFSLGPLLNLHQFGEFMALIKSLSAKIEREQTRKLQELSSSRDSGGFQNGTGNPLRTALDAGQSNSDSARDNFERLVLGKGPAASNNQDLMNPWSGVNHEFPSSRTSYQGASTGSSWSSSATPPARSLSNLDRGQSPPVQSQSGFRTVTPDYNLSSFPTLEPASRQKSPTTPAFPVLQPTPTGGSHSTQGSMSGSSLNALANLNISNNTAASGQFQQPSTFSAFTIPPPPTSTASGPYGKPSGVSNTSMSSLGMSNAGSFLNSAPSQPQGTQKQGLEKYESLL